MAYDESNIFAKILRGEIPNDTVLENQHVLAFNDITPKAPVHVLVIPKGQYTDIHDFGQRASSDEKAALFDAVAEIAEMKNFEEEGFRTIANTKSNGGQEVSHFHLHILGGAPMGPMVSSS